MKKIITYITGIGIATVLAFSLLFTQTGCKTTGTGTNTVDVAAVAAILQSTAEIATYQVVTKNPSYKVYFELVNPVLKTFILTSTNLSPIALAQALGNIKGLDANSIQGQLIINTIVNLYAATYGSVVKNGVANNDAATKLLTALSDGVAEGLVLAPAPANATSVVTTNKLGHRLEIPLLR